MDSATRLAVLLILGEGAVLWALLRHIHATCNAEPPAGKRGPDA